MWPEAMFTKLTVIRLAKSHKWTDFTRIHTKLPSLVFGSFVIEEALFGIMRALQWTMLCLECHEVYIFNSTVIRKGWAERVRTPTESWSSPTRCCSCSDIIIMSTDIIAFYHSSLLLPDKVLSSLFLICSRRNTLRIILLLIIMLLMRSPFIITLLLILITDQIMCWVDLIPTGLVRTTPLALLVLLLRLRRLIMIH